MLCKSYSQEATSLNYDSPTALGEEVEVELFCVSFKSPKVLDGEGLISEWPEWPVF